MQWVFSLVCCVLGLLLLLWCYSIQNYRILLLEDREFIWILFIRMLIDFLVYLAIIVPIAFFLIFSFLLLEEMLCGMFSLLNRSLFCDAIRTMKTLLKFEFVVCRPRSYFRFIAIALSKVTFFVCRPLHNYWGCLHLTKVRWKLKAWLRRPGHLWCTHINEVIEL